jgi:hypothetical protein
MGNILTIIKGSNFPQPQSFKYKFDPQRGYIGEYVYEGASQTAMLALQQDFVRASIECELEYIHDKAILTVSDSTNANPIDSWQMPVDEASRDGFSHPNVTTVATDAQIALLRAQLEIPANATVAFNSDPTLIPLIGTAVQNIYDLAFRGSPEYRKGYYVLRHATNVANTWQTNIADFGVDQIYSTAALLSEVSNNGLWVFPCPGRLQYKIANIPVEVPGSQDAFAEQYFWGWLKSISQEETEANNRIAIVTTYTLALWSTAYYAIY